MNLPERKTSPRNAGTVLTVVVAMAVGVLLPGLALLVSWLFIGLPRRSNPTQNQEALS